MATAEDLVNDDAYQFGFHDNIKPKFSTGRGLTEEIVRKISAEKNAVSYTHLRAHET